MTNVLLGCILLVLFGILAQLRKIESVQRRWWEAWGVLPVHLDKHQGDQLLEALREITLTLLSEVLKVEVMPNGSNTFKTSAERLAWIRENLPNR